MMGVTPPRKASSVDTTCPTATSLAATSSDIRRVCAEVTLLATSIAKQAEIAVVSPRACQPTLGRIIPIPHFARAYTRVSALQL